MPYLLGYDLGSSSIKATLLKLENGEVIASVTHPKQEMPMISRKRGWAEQKPEMWWENICHATRELMRYARIQKEEVLAIGISYQMHGLVVVDRDHNVLRPSIIWCDSRAVDLGKKAFRELGEEYCLSNLLNSPGNFTASKLRWIKEEEPEVFDKIFKAMLPGDYIAMRLTGEINTTISGLSEGIFWNYLNQAPDNRLLEYYGIDSSMLPEITSTFGVQGILNAKAAEQLGLKQGTPVAYRAGDQPNNAFSLNVLRPGQIAATAGTSGVVYGILESPSYDRRSRVNTFVHVNHQADSPKYGVLLCVNGTGILNSWMKNQLAGSKMSYDDLNELAAEAPIGSDGLTFLPFGNGAERILENHDINARIHGLNFNRHQLKHLLRAGQEGIVFALNYGFDVMRQMGMELQTVRAGKANMFLSPVFREAFCNLTGAVIELYNTDGSQGAARGAGVGAGIYRNFEEAFRGLRTIESISPNPQLMGAYEDAYHQWLNCLKN